MTTGIPFQLTVCGASELPDLARHRVSHLISIWHPSAERATYEPAVRNLFPNTKIHFVVFDDIESDLMIDDDDRPPTIDQVADVLEFTSSFTPRDHVGIHCLAGISRSSAVATAAVTQHMGAGSEAQSIAKVRQLRRQSRPNRMIIGFADHLLQRDGKLIRAVEKSFGAFPYESFKGWGKSESAKRFYA